MAMSKCAFCNVKFAPPAMVPHSLGAELQNYEVMMADPRIVSTAQIEYLDKHFQRLQEGVIKVPEVKFYTEYGKKYITEADLLDDDTLSRNLQSIKNLNVAKGIVRSRQTAQDEEDIARKFVCWAINTKTIPSTVLPSYNFGQYLSDMGSKAIHKLLRQHKLLGEIDVVCVTRDRGIALCEIKSTFEGSSRWEEDVEKAWYQTLKDEYFFQLLNSDFLFMTKIKYHKLVAYPNISSAKLKPLLCDDHFKHCMCKESFTTQDSFDAFVEGYLSAVGLTTTNSLSPDEYKQLGGRYITLSVAIEDRRAKTKTKSIKPDEIPTTSKAATETVKRIDKIGWKYLTPEQKGIIDNFDFYAGTIIKATINGHYSTGKTYTLQLGARRLFEMVDKSPDKHVILFSSLGFADLNGDVNFLQAGGGFKDTYKETFLEDVRGYFSDIANSNPKITFKVGHLVYDILNDFNILLSCEKCRKKNIDICDKGHEKKITVADIVKLLNAAKNKYLDSHQTEDNVHLFLDEVHCIGDTWELLNEFWQKLQKCYLVRVQQPILQRHGR